MSLRSLSVAALAILSFGIGFELFTVSTSAQPTTGGPFPIGYMLEIARGNIDGMSSIRKFCRNIEIDSDITADLWDGGHTLTSGGVSLIWVAPTQARIHQIASTSASDDGDPVGVGARTIRIFGLPDWDTAETSEVITLNGTTDVPTSAYVIIHRMKVLTKGGTNTNVGVITATADTDGTITAQINAGKGSTQMCVFGIPSTQTLFMTNYRASFNKSGGAAGTLDVSLLFNPGPDAELTNFRVESTEGIISTGTSHFQEPFIPPDDFAGPGIIKVQAVSGANDMDASAGFHGILVDN